MPGKGTVSDRPGVGNPWLGRWPTDTEPGTFGTTGITHRCGHCGASMTGELATTQAWWRRHMARRHPDLRAEPTKEQRRNRRRAKPKKAVA